MVSYEVICYNCKKKFRVFPGSTRYKQFKKNRNSIFCCEDCSHNIRLEAIKNFFRGI
ncbi:DUF2197 domain-containing protein [Siminovitchia terrae]|uniref:DUF2197 domain-containing protein n=1 Tax=Siminovitchia terrae TaxID=1914933 RepID=A0A429XB39_SIMTE|nr:DUF2197 domain-containing protein [Siminovitchia terrae]RST60572.1 DUF2197 domain-containing protein [Siminovitchia terrae]